MVITIGCVWQGRACQLVVHHEDGFMLYAAGTRGVAGNGISPGSPPTPLWRRPFDKLKMSADDGNRLLWLDFGGEDGEIVSQFFQLIFFLLLKELTEFTFNSLLIIYRLHLKFFRIFVLFYISLFTSSMNYVNFLVKACKRVIVELQKEKKKSH